MTDPWLIVGYPILLTLALLAGLRLGHYIARDWGKR